MKKIKSLNISNYILRKCIKYPNLYIKYPQILLCECIFSLIHHLLLISFLLSFMKKMSLLYIIYILQYSYIKK